MLTAGLRSSKHFILRIKHILNGNRKEIIVNHLVIRIKNKLPGAIYDAIFISSFMTLATEPLPTPRVFAIRLIPLP